MILFTVGTHHAPFDRLVRAAEAIAATTPERVVVQRGPSRVPAPHCEGAAWMSPTELAMHARAARVVVTHAGPGSIFLALDADVPIVVVPRDPARGEHVDDHQLRFAGHLADSVVVVTDTTRLPEALESVARPDRVQGDALPRQARSDAFALRLESVIDEILLADRPSCGRRMLRALRGVAR